MGTTLGLNGAYNLAAALTQHPDDHGAAFRVYEDRMRPMITKAQKLAPGMPRAMHPETAWGVWIMHFLIWFLMTSGIIPLLMRLKGSAATDFAVEDYGFESLQNWSEKEYKDFTRGLDMGVNIGPDQN
jgi:2-polyprenyl-6-methoxyphenol hydroxylase-like FAD-dependent oxidoreductase